MSKNTMKVIEVVKPNFSKDVLEKLLNDMFFENKEDFNDKVGLNLNEIDSFLVYKSNKVEIPEDCEYESKEVSTIIHNRLYTIEIKVYKYDNKTFINLDELHKNI